MGAGVVAAGFGAVDWGKMGQIAASWVISPVLGGVIAAAFLAFIKARIADVDDKLAAARFWVPILIGVMAGAFATYLSVKGLKKIVEISMGSAVILGIAIGIAALIVTRPIIRRQIRRDGEPQEVAARAVRHAAGNLGCAAVLCPWCE